MGEKNKQSLLDNISHDMQKLCLSDLKYVNGGCRQDMASLIAEKYPAESATLFEWNDALIYLTGNPAEASETMAREKLINHLQSK